MHCTKSQDSVREIEDIIDIQKASGSFYGLQVEQTFPEEPSQSVLSSKPTELQTQTVAAAAGKNRKRYFGSKYKKSPSDLISWPSGSDITVLRMNNNYSSKLSQDIRKNIPGDGLHLPLNSSMVNLATVIITDSVDSSKNNEEFLLPLTSWDLTMAAATNLLTHDTYITVLKENRSDGICVHDKPITDCPCMNKNHQMTSCRVLLRQDESNSSIVSLKYARSKIARFFRLYFCPCCPCLYRMEARCEQAGRCSERADQERHYRQIDY